MAPFWEEDIKYVKYRDSGTLKTAKTAYRANSLLEWEKFWAYYPHVFVIGRTDERGIFMAPRFQPWPPMIREGGTPHPDWYWTQGLSRMTASGINPDGNLYVGNLGVESINGVKIFSNYFESTESSRHHDGLETIRTIIPGPNGEYIVTNEHHLVRKFNAAHESQWWHSGWGWAVALDSNANRVYTVTGDRDIEICDWDTGDNKETHIAAGGDLSFNLQQQYHFIYPEGAIFTGTRSSVDGHVRRLLKANHAGVIQWEIFTNDIEGYPRPERVAGPMPDGGVIFCQSSVFTDPPIVVRVDADGEEVWVKNLGVGDGDDVRALTVDRHYNIWVLQGYHLSCYSIDGDLLQEASYDSEGYSNTYLGFIEIWPGSYSAFPEKWF